MKGDDEVWHGAITAEKRSRPHSPASTVGENSVMNAGCHPTIRVRISGCGRKTPPSVVSSNSKGGGVTATGSGYRVESG